MAMDSIGGVELNPASKEEAPPIDKPIEPFIQPAFDAADYLNATLPALSIGPVGRGSNDRATLADLSSKTQVLLSQLNAQTSRLSSSLNRLTDEIVRSGSRLAYEVEILRGETTGLSDLLVDKLQDDFDVFGVAAGDGVPTKRQTGASEPDHITQLRTLAQVRGRLDSVIKVFGEAMEWPVAPSELSSSLISVTAPDVTAEEQQRREEKGKEVAQKLRDGVVTLLETSATPEEGIAAATRRINDLRRLALVWKGTAEEKFRNRFVDGLAKLVDDEQKKLSKKSEGRRQAPVAPAAAEKKTAPEPQRGSNEASYGFMNSLRKMRGDIYIE